MADLPPVVLDCGTSLIKAGLSGSPSPTFVEPTAIATRRAKQDDSSPTSPLADLDYFIGDEAVAHSPAYSVSYPMKHGVITDFQSMEKIWISTIFKKLHVNPKDHYFILTEPPLNTPENRETTAEIMFETIGVSGLHIGVQAVLALYGAKATGGETHNKAATSLTGVVIDSGDGCTHCVPVAEGYVLGSSICSIPIAGRNVSDLILKALKDRKEQLPANKNDALQLAKTIKEKYAYVCGDIVKEIGKYDADPTKYRIPYREKDVLSGKTYKITVQEERFLGPEIFFNPVSYGIKYEHTKSLSHLVDDAIQNCAIDTRRALYGNITLSGGSTMFKNFDVRLQRDVQRILESRAVDVCVKTHPQQRFAVWYGGSVLGQTPGFKKLAVSRQEYDEHGPRIMRSSPVYKEF